MIFADLTNNENINLNSNRKQNHLVRVSEQEEEKNFKKVSDFLTERLKKILTEKYVNNSSKKCRNNMNNFMTGYDPGDNLNEFSRILTQPTMMSMSQTFSKKFSRGSLKRARESIKLPISRSHTSEGKSLRVKDDR
jgi:hypothetical protein